jgi:hypothetical protein
MATDCKELQINCKGRLSWLRYCAKASATISSSCTIGKRHCLPIGKVEPDEAEVAQVAYLLMRLDQGLLQLPVATDIVTYVRFDGKPLPEVPAAKGDRTLAHLQAEYLSIHRRALEDSTITGIAIHFKHLLATLGPRPARFRIGLPSCPRRSPSCPASDSGDS